MLAFFVNPKHRLVVFLVVLGLALIGIVYGFQTGAFQQNNREALRVEREAAALVSDKSQ